MLALDQQYEWADARIVINQNHSYWKSGKDSIKLEGEFVEKCLWTPHLHYINVHHIDVFQPTPTSVLGSPIEYYLEKTGTVCVFMRNVKLTVSCGLDFDKYPFERQVSISIECIEVNRIVNFNYAIIVLFVDFRR